MSIKLQNDLTCIVPTYNRPKFLRRLLSFWDEVGVPAPVLVADSTEGPLQGENLRVIEQLGSRVPIRYEHFTAGVIDKMAAALDLVTTPFVFFSADDDFILPAGVLRSVDFLRESPDYVAAQGMIVSIRQVVDGRCRIMRAYDLDSESAARRFEQMATHWYSTFYAVNRTKELQECFRVTLAGPRYDEARIYPEFMLSQMTALVGKVKFLPELYSVWQLHEENQHRILPAVQELDEGKKHYLHFRAVLGAELARYSGLSEDVCTAMVDRHFSSLVTGHSSSQRPTDKAKSELMRVVRRIYGYFKTNAILERRTLTPRHPQWQNAAWQLAHHLVLTYPHGVAEGEDPYRALAARVA